MTTPVATATVRILPDTTGFRAALEAELALATKGISASIGSGVSSGLAGTAAAGGAASKALKGIKADSEGAAAGLAAVKEESLAARLGLVTAEGESNALRGALIGLSRVTPVTVFGLGVAGTAAIGAGLAFKSAISQTEAFEHQLAIFQVTSNATAEQMRAVEKEAKALGGDLTLPGVSAGDAARALTELAKGGLSVKDSLAAARGTLQLSAAAQIDVGQAADYVVTELNAFGLAGNQAVHIADLLAGASIAAQGSITDFGTAFQQVSAVARQTGLTVEQTTGALTELAKAGLRGADGGTSLRTTLLRLTPTTKQAAQFQQALGIELNKNLPIGKQLNDVIDQYRRALSALTPIQQQQALAQIFGQDAIRAASILIRGGSQALDENTRAANQNGAAQRLAQGNAKGLYGAFNNLSNSLSTLSIDLGDFVKGPLASFVTVAAEAVSQTDAWITDLGKLPGLLKRANDAIPGPKIPTKNVKDAFNSAVSGLPLGGLIQAFENNKDQDKNAKQIRDAFKSAIEKAAAQTTGDQFGNATPNRRGALAITGTSFLDPLSKEAAAKIQAAITAQIARNKITKANKDITAPLGLQNVDLQAQLNGDLQQELKADQTIENYFENRLKTAVKGTARYTKILAALVAAHANTTSIQQQITSNAKQARDKAVADAKQAAADAKQAAQALFHLQQSTLDLALQRAQVTPGTADDTKARQDQIRLLKNQIDTIKQHTKLTVEERQTIIDDTAQVVSLQSAINADAAAQKQALFNLEKSQLDLAIQRAGLTPGTADDIKANQAEINRYKQQIARIEAIKKHRKLTIEERQAIIDDQSAIASLQATIQGIKGQQQGATAADIFKEAASEFTAFGSNIAQRGGLLSGQDARASFAARVLNKASAQSVAKVIADQQATRDKASLTEAQKQTQLLRGIYGVLGGPRAEGRSPKPSTEAIHRARQLARSGT